MSIRRLAMPLLLALALSLQPTLAQNKQINAVSGVLLVDTSCPGSGFDLADCPCVPPLVLYHVVSTKVDLAAYAGNFVTLRGAVREPGCVAPFFEARKATIEPNRPCPCPVAGVAADSSLVGARGPDAPRECTR